MLGGAESMRGAIEISEGGLYAGTAGAARALAGRGRLARAPSLGERFTGAAPGESDDDALLPSHMDDAEVSGVPGSDSPAPGHARWPAAEGRACRSLAVGSGMV